MLKFQLVGEIKKHWNTFPFVMHGKRTLFSIFKEKELLTEILSRKPLYNVFG